MIKTIFHLPIRQGLVTQYRFSYNEVFNREILQDMDKRIDFWASYRARHALSVIDNNEGLEQVLLDIRSICTNTPFSKVDLDNISNLVSERDKQGSRNREAIHSRHQKRHEQFAQDQKELQGFDFSQVII